MGPGVAFRIGAWNISKLRDSVFCLCPSGTGFDWRVYLALTTQCIPVIIQPMVRQAYHDLLPYSKLALTYSMADVRQLPELLRSVPHGRICELRAQAARYYRALMWQAPDGIAYDLLQLSLCRRALTMWPKGQPPPAWAACARISAEHLLRHVRSLA